MAQGQPQQVIEIAQPLIRDAATIRQGTFPTALFSWRTMMSNAGRAEEGYRYLLEVRPGLDDFSSAPSDFKGAMMRQALLELSGSFLPPEQQLEAWNTHWAQREQLGDRSFLEDPYLVMLDHLFNGRLEAAVESALEDLAQPLAAWPLRPKTYHDALIKPIADDPRVAARLAELKREWAQQREQVLALLQEPEWSP
jgi:hypothetical protein